MDPLDSSRTDYSSKNLPKKQTKTPETPVVASTQGIAKKSLENSKPPNKPLPIHPDDVHDEFLKKLPELPRAKRPGDQKVQRTIKKVLPETNELEEVSNNDAPLNSRAHSALASPSEVYEKSPFETRAFKDSDVMDDIMNDSRLLENFRKFCTISLKSDGTLTFDHVQKFVKDGELLAKKISEGTIDAEDKNPQNIVKLMWFMTALCAKADKLYTNGSMRIDDPDGKLQKFLEDAAGPNIYERVSSHMKENVVKSNKQKGVDLREGNLPAKAGTLLFAPQPDKTLFLKMEAKGLPPFWKKGFATLDNFKEFVGHSMLYIKTRFHKKGISDLATRKEHVPKDISTEFTNVVKALFPPKKETIFQKVGSVLKPVSDEAKKLIKEGKKHGISKMDEILESESIDSSEKYNLLKAKLKQRIEEAARDGYIGRVKGNEVNLPSFAKLFELRGKAYDPTPKNPE